MSYTGDDLRKLCAEQHVFGITLVAPNGTDSLDIRVTNGMTMRIRGLRDDLLLGYSDVYLQTL